MGRRQRLLRGASNVMFGIALGLLSYYAMTTVVGWLAQRSLKEDAGPVASYRSDLPEKLLVAEGPVLDFEGWQNEDAAAWQALESGAVFARLVIPDIGVDALVVNGVRTADLRRGPGWIDWTDLPGPVGTCGISGHRTTYGAPFARIDELKPGDTIDLFSPYRRYRYAVTSTLIVRPEQTEVVAPTDDPSLTLTACHPPYSARYRIAVQAALVEVRRLSDAEE